MKLLILLPLFFVNSAIAENTAYVSPTRTLSKGGTEFNFFTEYFQTTSVVTQEGEAFALAGNNNYQQADFGLNIKYGLTEQFEAIGGIRGRSISALVTVSDEEYALTNTGLESGYIGFKYAFVEEEGVQFAIEGTYSEPFYTNPEYNGGAPDSIVLGDAGNELSAGLSAMLKTKSLNAMTARVLYREPAKQQSSEVFSEIDFNIVWPSFYMGLGVENVYSLQNDIYSNDQANKPQVSTGPSYLYNSINRSWTAPFFHSAIRLGETWRLAFKYTAVTTGNSTDLGNRISFSLVKRNDKKINSFRVVDQAFKQYSIEGTVSKISKSRKAFMIDRGLAQGLKKGMRVDFFYFDFLGGNELIATGVAIKVGASKSMVQLKKRYTKKRIEVGTVARSGLIVNSEK